MPIIKDAICQYNCFPSSHPKLINLINEKAKLIDATNKTKNRKEFNFKILDLLLIIYESKIIAVNNIQTNTDLEWLKKISVLKLLTVIML